MSEITALTDEQLRRIAAHIALDAIRERAGDTVGHIEALDDVLAELGIDIDEDELAADEQQVDAIAERIGELIAGANLTVEWDGHPMSLLFEANPVDEETR